LLYFEDLDSLIENGLDISSFLNMMDGISTKNGLLVIATANEIKKLKSNITQRPSRFDRKFEIPLPNQENAYIYLKRWFGNSITVKKCRELAKYAERYEFSYAYLKELYVSSMFQALANNRSTLIEKDVDNALIILVKEKNILNTGKAIDTNRYFNK
jgi:transitional endoplasmic reticulum ATPase